MPTSSKVQRQQTESASTENIHLRVETTAGTLEGRERDGALLFAGIPYAAPPIGALRFRPPEPHPGWQGLREAKRFGPGAPQLPGIGPTAAPVRWYEDCLTLNVCTPALEGEPRPVLVWIHGGGFRNGQGAIPWYSGTSFARLGDIVTVSINYRLGALGFANLADLDSGDGGFSSSGLNGILDQVAALEWVRDNIASFGGDPAKVTIAGESAGAMSVGMLLGLPAARGLFRGAIAQSGAAAHHLSNDVGRAVGRAFARELGAETRDDLYAAGVDDILAAQARVEKLTMKQRELEGVTLGRIGGMPFQPSLDERVLARPPVENVREGQSADVALLIGTNAHESTLFGVQTVTADRLESVVARSTGLAPEGIEVYRAARPNAGAGDLMVAIATDYTFRIPALRLAEAQLAAGGRCFQYFFAWESRGFGGRMGATHALEIPFVFNNLSKPGVDVFLGEGPLPTELAERMHGAWTAFIREGDPNGEGLPAWPGYDLDRRATMEFGETCRVLDDPAREERELWDDLR